MGTRIKILVTMALVGACGALALPSAAGAAVRSGVTIHTLHGYEGFVFSPKPRKCADGRKVELFKQKGKEQHPKRDVKVDHAQSFENSAGKFRWEAHHYGLHPGHFYARVPATAACQADNSKTTHVSARPNTKITDMGCQGCGNGDPHPRNVYFYFRGFGSISPYGYRCKIDHRPYKPCSSGRKMYRHLSFGHHVFRVFAIAHHGKRDRTPAKRGFRVRHHG